MKRVILTSLSDASLERDGKGVEELVRRLGAVCPVLIALEATGGFETLVAAALASAKLPLAIVNPAQVRYFAKANNKRAKTDRIDAAVIAHFAEAMKPSVRALPEDAARLFAELIGSAFLAAVVIGSGIAATLAAAALPRSGGAASSVK